MDEFTPCFSEADILCLMDIYSAGEKPINGIDSNALLDRIKKTGHKDAAYFSDRGKLMENLLMRLKSGDVVFTLGAGDVWKLGEEILKRIKVREMANKKQSIVDERLWQKMISSREVRAARR